MPMFTIYLDASGHPDSTDALSVAGFIAPTEQWIRIERGWKKVLDKYGVSELHMKLFAHSRGEYSSWKGESRKRAAFLTELIGVIQPRVRHSFSCSVWMEDYNKANQDARLRRLISPLAVAGLVCINRAQEWATLRRLPFDNMRYLIEDGDVDKGNLMTCAKVLLNVAVTPAPKSSSIAFQAADLLAFEQFLLLKKTRGTQRTIYSVADIRKSLLAMASIPCGKDRGDWSYKSGEEFTAILTRLKNAAYEIEASVQVANCGN
jgi:hypothetical protein